MPELNEVLDSVQREVKGLGDDVKGLKTSFEKDLSDVRKLAEEAQKKGGDGELKNAVDVLSKGVAEKHAAIEAAVKKIEEESIKAAKDRMDEFERKLNKMRLTGGQGDVGDEMKSARDFQRTMMSLRGELKAGTILSDDKINVDEFKAYQDLFPTYLRKDNKGFDHEQVKTMSVGNDPNGGFLVTPAISSRMLTKIYESSPIRELAYIETISSDKLELPIDEGEADAGWVGETQARAETGTPEVGSQTIEVFEMYAKPKATQKLLEDASINVEGWLGTKIGQKFGRMEASAFVLGNGMRKPRGFLTYPAGTNRRQIEQILSGNATGVTFDGLIKLVTALKEYYAGGAVFLMRRASIGSVLLLKDGNGQYIWRPNVEAGKPSLLLGYSVREAADMPAVGAGALPIAFGNFNAGYTIADRLGVTTLVDPYSAKPFVEFYTRKRVGGDVTTFEAIKLLKVSE